MRLITQSDKPHRNGPRGRFVADAHATALFSAVSACPATGLWGCAAGPCVVRVAHGVTALAPERSGPCERKPPSLRGERRERKKVFKGVSLKGVGVGASNRV